MKDLQNKLKDYSKTAVLLLSSTTAANAGVIYTDISPDTTLTTNGDIYNIDLNNDAINDFSISFDNNSTFSSVGIQNLAVGNYYAADSFFTDYAAALNTGTAISNSNISYWGTDNGSGFKDNMGWYSSSYSSSYGYWAGQSNKFVGVKFLISGAVHFGWIRASIPVGYSSVTIHDYAYESVADTSILTGAGIPITNNINITECDSANVFGNTFTTSQIVSDTIVGGSAGGLDSITIANITINNSFSTNIDTSVVSGSSITIDGVSVNTAGTYSEVFQTVEGCDSTINYNVSIIQGLNDSFTNNVKVYPNPATKTLFIENKDAIITSIQLYNNHGKLFYSENNLNSKNAISIQLDTYPKGVYFLELTSDENRGMKKIVIE